MPENVQAGAYDPGLAILLSRVIWSFDPNEMKWSEIGFRVGEAKMPMGLKVHQMVLNRPIP